MNKIVNIQDARSPHAMARIRADKIHKKLFLDRCTEAHEQLITAGAMVQDLRELFPEQISLPDERRLRNAEAKVYRAIQLLASTIFEHDGDL